METLAIDRLCTVLEVALLEKGDRAVSQINKKIEKKTFCEIRGRTTLRPSF